MSFAGSEHPHLLLWYVSGDLPEEQRREINTHLSGCESCRSEVGAIRVVLDTVRIEDRAARQSSRFPSGRARSEGGGSSIREARAPVHRPGWQLAAAGLVVGILPGVLLGNYLSQGDSAQRTGTLGALTTIMLQPPMRGLEQEPILHPPGPWAAVVRLPFGAPEGGYTVSIERKDGPAPEGAAVVVPSSEGALTLLLPSLPGPASLSLVVRSAASSEAAGAEAGEPPIEYPFRIAFP